MSTALDISRSPAALYPLFRWLARTAVSWYYRDVEVHGVDRMPSTGATLLAVNHSNALVDALVAVSIVPRRLRITAKATIFEVPVLGALLRALGMVPLRRLSDEQRQQNAGDGARPSADRNAAAFEALTHALGRGEVVLIFPEGISHVAPELAPLKSGLARIAIGAVQRGINPVVIVPLGLTFEQRDAPRSRVLAEFGDPVVVTGAMTESLTPDTLTAQVGQELREVTLNFASHEAAQRVRDIATALARLTTEDDSSLATAEPRLGLETAIAKRVQAAAGLLDTPDCALRQRAVSLLDRLDHWTATAEEAGVTVDDLWVDVRFEPAIRFVFRESLIALAVGPLAAWGAINHWVPLRLARWIGLRTTRHPDEPAMRTIAAGFALVIAFYVVQTIVVGALAGPWWALGYLLTLPLSATWDFRFRDRWRRVFERARTYLVLRRHPGLRRALQAEAREVWEEAVELEERGVGD
jgi:1-acyl-sn-glycerol-3-phosphate acyltransferase